MSNEHEDMSSDEKHLAKKVVQTLYWIVILLLLLAILFQIYAGLKNWLWYIVIPAWAALNFTLRVLKTYFRNIVKELEKDDSPDENNEDTPSKSVRFRSMNLRNYLSVFVAMLCVSSLWYFVGFGVSKLN